MSSASQDFPSLGRPARMVSPSGKIPGTIHLMGGNSNVQVPWPEYGRRLRLAFFWLWADQRIP